MLPSLGLRALGCLQPQLQQALPVLHLAAQHTSHFLQLARATALGTGSSSSSTQQSDGNSKDGFSTLHTRLNDYKKSVPERLEVFSSSTKHVHSSTRSTLSMREFASMQPSQLQLALPALQGSAQRSPCFLQPRLQARRMYTAPPALVTDTTSLTVSSAAGSSQPPQAISDVDDKAAAVITQDSSLASSDDHKAPVPKHLSVHIKQWSPSVAELDRLVKSGHVDLQPKYQRGLVWSKAMASRAVITALEDRMIPTFYFQEDERGRYSVMDGKQRLASLLAFLNANPYIGAEDTNSPEYRWDNAPVKLHITDDMSVGSDWSGIKFTDLPEGRQNAFKNYTINGVVVLNTNDRDVLMHVYADVNSGSVAHTAQQGRRAVYYGPYIDLLDKVARDREFLQIQGRRFTDREKETDRELALRFFAMRRFTGKNFETPIFRFLNHEIRQYRDMSDKDAKDLRKIFTQTTDTVWNVFGDMSCRDLTGKFSPYLWDATMVAVCEELFPDGPASPHTQRKSELYNQADAIKLAYEKLLVSSDFKATLASTSSAKITKRIRMMQELLREAPKTMEPDKKRTFTPKQRESFWEESKASAPGGAVVCGECCNVIHTLGDAHLDHVKPHSRGGLTALDNAQWLHAHCNLSKGSRPVQQYAGGPMDFAVREAATTTATATAAAVRLAAVGAAAVTAADTVGKVQQADTLAAEKVQPAGVATAAAAAASVEKAAASPVKGRRTRRPRS